MDPDNPIVKLCVAGMRAEGEGRLEEARRLFARAWEARRDAFDGCIAAHYLARHQRDAEEILYWNQVALACAEAVGDERVTDFYPSLYLNLGWSHEQLGDAAEAQRYYKLAAARLEAGGLTGAYRTIVERGVAGGQARLASGAGYARPIAPQHAEEAQ